MSTSRNSDGDAADRRFDCPSAQPDMEGARPIGVISGTPEETRVAYFKKSAADGFDWRQHFGMKDATRLLRFGARCEENGCAHFASDACSLGQRIKTLPPVVDALPSCLLRPTCRWFAEQGPGVCLRCPQVVTIIPEGDTALNRAAAVRSQSPEGVTTEPPLP